jgi:hypothetical protein
MSYVKAPNFVRYSSGGELEVLLCKLCGVVIGEKQHRTIGFRTAPNGQKIERIVENFVRNHLYCEIKIVYEDGSAHVTNGCKTCLNGPLSVEALDELTFVDEQDLKLSLGRKAAEVVERKIGGGIV